MDDFIPVNEPVISEEAKIYVNDALNTGWVSSAGKYVGLFEEKFAEYIGTKYAVAVSNGTAALHVALLSLGIGPGDEVIIPAFTMAASWLAVIFVGAKPVFVDCEPETYCIDPKLIEKKITKKTKAIMPVHIYGHPADMDPIMKIAKKHKLFVVEDAAEAHGATYRGKKVGSFGVVNCFSFYGNKIVTTGEGGMVVTNDEKLAEAARKFKDLHHSTEKRFIHDGVGFNYRLTNLQAALGCGQLEHVEEYLLKKQYMANLYGLLLKDIPGVRTPITKRYATNVYWMYSVLVDPEKIGITKDELRDRLKEKGIDTRDFFYPPKDQPVLKKYLNKTENFPIAEDIATRGLYLPSGLAITENQMIRVAKTIKSLEVHSLKSN
ncbi:aminotransferase DegT [Candidatus Woesebacteria bacterium RBG_13_46_13]|uniref:Aminotransferase DegT n=1 Tax=Candidatus Woesebacteria bacterium RBG_13_46_13 TaxID=1802479 RepID=A0A1F7X2R8_9BACT|nr:MAG: aminotransferase DegT [Candidatus Woesebacteria bacterium RBG_13_46_13]